MLLKLRVFKFCFVTVIVFGYTILVSGNAFAEYNLPRLSNVSVVTLKDSINKRTMVSSPKWIIAGSGNALQIFEKTSFDAQMGETILPFRTYTFTDFFAESIIKQIVYMPNLVENDTSNTYFAVLADNRVFIVKVSKDGLFSINELTSLVLDGAGDDTPMLKRLFVENDLQGKGESNLIVITSNAEVDQIVPIMNIDFVQVFNDANKFSLGVKTDLEKIFHETMPYMSTNGEYMGYAKSILMLPNDQNSTSLMWYAFDAGAQQYLKVESPLIDITDISLFSIRLYDYDYDGNNDLFLYGDRPGEGTYIWTYASRYSYNNVDTQYIYPVSPDDSYQLMSIASVYTNSLNSTVPLILSLDVVNGQSQATSFDDLGNIKPSQVLSSLPLINIKDVIAGEFDGIPGEDFLVLSGKDSNQMSIFKSVYYSPSDKGNLCVGGMLSYKFTPIPDAKYSYYFTSASKGTTELVATATTSNPGILYTYDWITMVSSSDQEGTYKIVLTGADNEAIATYKDSFLIGVPPKAIFSLTTRSTICSGELTEIEDNSTVSDTRGTRFLKKCSIDWGTGSPSEDFYYPASSYIAGDKFYQTNALQSAGIYTITVILTDEDVINLSTCSIQKLFTVTVQELPQASFTLSGGCAKDNVVSISCNNTTSTTYDIVWDFGDVYASSVLGATNARYIKNESTVSHTYSKSGDYGVILTLKDLVADCSTQQVSNITIEDTAISDYDWEVTAPMPLCNNLTISFSNNEPTVSSSFGTIKDINYYFDYANFPKSMTTVLPDVFGQDVSHSYPPSTNTTDQDYTYLICREIIFNEGCSLINKKEKTIFFVPTISITLSRDVSSLNPICDNNNAFEVKVTDPLISGTWRSSIGSDPIGSSWMIYPTQEPLGQQQLWAEFTVAKSECIVTATYNMEVFQTPILTLDPIIELCQYKPATLFTPIEATGLAIENWTFSGSEMLKANTSNPSSVYIEPTIITNGQTISVTVKAQNGCDTVATSKLIVRHSPSAFKIEGGEDNRVFDNEEIYALKGVKGLKYKLYINQDDKTEFLYYKWTSSTEDNIFLNGANTAEERVQIFASSDYNIKVTNAEGCSSSQTITINLIDERIDNLFTPNDDGFNDTWYYGIIAPCPKCDIEIFTRYGKSVYKKHIETSSDGNWDGKLSGVELPIGVYYYVIESSVSSAKSAGSVAIIR